MSTTTPSFPSAALATGGARTSDAQVRAAVWDLARLEAARNVRGAPLWIVLLALAAATGVAAGRALRQRIPGLVLGVVLWFLFGMVTWAWEGAPVRYVTPVQTQPIEQAVGSAGADPATFPDHWLLSAPDEYDREWDRVIVHQPMAAWHDVYLVGLTLAAVGFAIRGRGGRRALVAGALVATIGVGVQAVVAPPPSAEPAVWSREGP